MKKHVLQARRVGSDDYLSSISTTGLIRSAGLLRISSNWCCWSDRT
ncbi:hypothetical protein [Negativicoccus succinicivorans]|nr:hypothetical protein [Negativicoccus succinicivorans]